MSVRLVWGAFLGAQEPWLVDVAVDLGLSSQHSRGAAGDYYMPEIMGAGAALLDFDRDGDLDVFLLGGGRSIVDVSGANRLFRNDLTAEGPRFVDVTSVAEIETVGYGMGVGTGDVNGDGWLDLYVASYGSNQLLLNLGDGRFRDVTASSGTGDERWSVAVSFLDYDRDGDIDLFVGNYVDFSRGLHRPCYDRSSALDYCGPTTYAPVADRLFRNRGDGTFEDTSFHSGIGQAPGSGLGSAAVDLDEDGWVDLYVANDLMPNRLWINQRDGTFRDEGALSGSSLNLRGEPEASMGVAVVDGDANGVPDLFVTHLDGQTNTLYLNEGGGFFLDATDQLQLGSPSWPVTGFGVRAIDLDRDGWSDLYVANGGVTTIAELTAKGDPNPFHQPDQVFVYDRAGELYRDAATGWGLPRRAGRGVASGDIDGDGDEDLLVTSNDAPVVLLENRAPVRHSWLRLEVLREGRPAPLVLHTGALREGAIPAQWRWSGTDGSYASASDHRVTLAWPAFGDGDPPRIRVSTEPPIELRQLAGGRSVRVISDGRSRE